MSLTKLQKASVSQKIRTNISISSEILDASNTVQVILLDQPYSKISFQASGDLAGALTFSLDGVNYKDSTSIGASNAVVSFSAHLVRGIKITRSGGSGSVAIAAAV